DTVAKAVSEWREHAAAALKPSTRRSAESHLRRHILPLLGECPLADLTVKKMQTFVFAERLLPPLHPPPKDAAHCIPCLGGPDCLVRHYALRCANRRDIPSSTMRARPELHCVE